MGFIIYIWVNVCVVKIKNRNKEGWFWKRRKINESGKTLVWILSVECRIDVQALKDE